MAHHVVVLVPQLGGWRALVPDFPECDADAAHLESAIDQAISKALQSRIDRQARGQESPIARTYAEIRTDTRWANAHNVQMRTAVICWANLRD